MRGRVFLLLLGALLISFGVSEAVIRYAVRYPDYGIIRFIYGISSSTKWQPQYRPHSRYLNNELPGFHVFSRNNLGLPGVDTDKRGKPVFILGSSFIEAAQIAPDKIASSVCQREIQRIWPQYSVFNLGRKAHDIYDSWFRYQYYKQLYPPDTVILILDKRNSFERHTLPLDFQLPPGFGKSDTSATRIAGNYILSSSSLFALLYRGFRDTGAAMETSAVAAQNAMLDPDYEAESRRLTLQCVKDCLLAFAADAGSKLIVISMFDKDFMNHEIDAWCAARKIFHLSAEDIQTPQFQLKQMGHLNDVGNARLGKLAATAFFRYKTKNP